MGKVVVHGEASVIFREAGVDYYLPSQGQSGTVKGCFVPLRLECMQRWREHFDCVLNAPGQFLQATIESFPSYDVRDDMANAPAMEEVRTALSHIAGNRAGGSSGILPEMVKVCSNELLEYLVKLFTRVWNTGSVPQDWKFVAL